MRTSTNDQATIIEEVKKRSRSYFERMQALKQRVRTMRSTLDDAERSKQSLQETLKEQGRYIEVLELGLERQAVAGDVAHEQIAELEVKLQEREIELEELTTKLESFRNRIRSTNGRLHALEGAVKEFQDAPGVTPALRRELAKLCREYDSSKDKQTEALQRRVSALMNARDELRTRTNTQRTLLGDFSTLSPIRRVLNIANAAEASMPDGVDCIVTHGMMALPVYRLYAGTGVRRVNDCIEIPSFAHRARAPNWRRDVIDVIDRYLESYFRESDAVLTVSEALADIVRGYGLHEVTVLPNFRKYAPPPDRKSSDLRQRLDIPAQAVVMISVGLVVTGCVELLDAFRRIDGDPHLVLVGNIVPDSYETEILQAIEKFGLEKRVHLLPPVPYEELTKFVAGADLGLIIRDPRILNNAVSLPNRVFDFIASGVPFLTPRIPDIQRMIDEFRCGMAVDGVDADDWHAAILAARPRLDAMRSAAISANEELAWENEKDKLASFFDGARHVAFVAASDLTINNRTYRICESLQRIGVRTSIRSPGGTDRRRLDVLGIDYAPLEA